VPLLAIRLRHITFSQTRLVDTASSFTAANANTPSVARKPKGRGYERRDEILAAAARMFVALGTEKVSTRRIAQEVGISQTSLYVYFPNKAALLDVLCNQSFAKFLASARTPEAKAGTALERLRWLLLAYVRFGVAHPDEYRLCFLARQPKLCIDQTDMAVLQNPETARKSLAPAMQCFLELQDRVDDLARIENLKLHPRLAAQILWAAVHGLVALLISMPSFPWEDRETLVNGTVDVQLGGLLVRIL